MHAYTPVHGPVPGHVHKLVGFAKLFTYRLQGLLDRCFESRCKLSPFSCAQPVVTRRPKCDYLEEGRTIFKLIRVARLCFACRYLPGFFYFFLFLLPTTTVVYSPGKRKKEKKNLNLICQRYNSHRNGFNLLQRNTYEFTRTFEQR